MSLENPSTKFVECAELESVISPLPTVPLSWFVMRDLKRPNAKHPAYLELSSAGFEVFTPLKSRLAVRGGRRIREEHPYLPDLLFVHSVRSSLDAYVELIPTLQYRYVRGAYCVPMTVDEREMSRFIHAVRSSENPRFYLPGELDSSMYGRRVRIVGGALDGYEGSLLSIRGTRVRRLLVEIPNLLTAAIEVSPEYVQLV